MKKIILILVALAIVSAIPAVVCAGDFPTSTNWRITKIEETRIEQALVKRDLKVECGDEYRVLSFTPNDPDSVWQAAKRVQVEDWLWLDEGPRGNVVVHFGHLTPAQLELGNILD